MEAIVQTKLIGYGRQVIVVSQRVWCDCRSYDPNCDRFVARARSVRKHRYTVPLSSGGRGHENG